ncbi:MAG: N-acetyltransferase [Deltaproteobacteria bacterium]|jgi:predicted GNAT family acetyltransferase|nr:N-acetyltransferase [Deltaproteobacteria bacterium]
MSNIEIAHEEIDGRGAFFLDREGVRLAEMTYSRVTPSHVIVDHTEVHAKLQGMGVARKLLDTLVAWARTTGTKITATCPYAKAQFDKDASIRDVLATD